MKFGYQKIVLSFIFAITVFMVSGCKFMDDEKKSNAATMKVSVSSQEEFSKLPSKCRAINDPYGSNFDWKAVTSNEELEACLLKLARNLQHGERMVDWLERQGFHNVSFHSSTPGVAVVNAQWRQTKSGAVMPFEPNFSLWEHWITKDSSYDISVRYDDGYPHSSSAGHRLN